MADRERIPVSTTTDALLRAANAAAARAVLNIPSTAEQDAAITAAITAALEAAVAEIQPYLDAIDGALEEDSFQVCDGSTIHIAKGLITRIDPPEEPPL
jgi:hypothetical protein